MKGIEKKLLVLSYSKSDRSERFFLSFLFLGIPLELIFELKKGALSSPGSSF